MRVRIYDLAKKLGLESKDVLAKAKKLGIAAAKVPSSSLDKITAEYLESQFSPKVAAKAPEPVAAPVPTPAVVEAPFVPPPGPAAKEQITAPIELPPTP